MRKAIKTIGIATTILFGLAATSPLYAHSKSKPAQGQDMMQGGGMMGMMDMMAQMNKMMELCNKMMASAMDGDHGKMKMPEEAPPKPGKEG
jgi:hypothetical protein